MATPLCSLLPDFPELDAHCMLEPAKDVAGDFFDAFAVDRHTVCIAIGDVAGKGMAASLFAVRTMSLLRTHIGKDCFNGTM